ncbi:hypothetical protein FHU38_002119 [Saccharomonospora amisosensis]|uniref:DUF998 domain-containing protein n=1 Tax=Saccharomonospora amisosensis TaxID=1128677 RepID=A0A7X5UPH6_9PSEU|nr:hypothetical protein [Saccharomonospora amisosensis]NIJ11775.1 hypothetical protein [Saccharomonospora amisosensis]
MTTKRLGALALASAGVLFLLYPAVRPWYDESTVDGATRSMSSSAWVASHLFAMLGFVLVSLALLSLRRRTPAAVFWAGAGLTLPYYGAEDFALHAVARHQADVLAITEDFRYGPVAVTMFATGLLAMAAGAVLAARTAGPGGRLFAAGFVLFLPQFFTPAPVRIAHGVLLLAGCLWLAHSLWRGAVGDGTGSRSTAAVSDGAVVGDGHR